MVYMVGSREEHEALFDAVTIRSLLWPDPEHFDAFGVGPPPSWIAWSVG